MATGLSFKDSFTVRFPPLEVTQTFSLIIEDTTSSGGAAGSMGWLALLLVPVVAIRRRKMAA